jgi:hypothetical protein
MISTMKTSHKSVLASIGFLPQIGLVIGCIIGLLVLAAYLWPQFERLAESFVGAFLVSSN